MKYFITILFLFAAFMWTMNILQIDIAFKEVGDGAMSGLALGFLFHYLIEAWRE